MIEMQEMYDHKKCLSFLLPLLQDEDNFITSVTSFDYSNLSALFESITSLITDHKNIFYLVHQLKKLIKAANTMAESMVLGESMERIVNETCECLECDRASVFLVDHAKEELWSKVAKGSEITIRIPMNTGIVGEFNNIFK